MFSSRFRKLNPRHLLATAAVEKFKPHLQEHGKNVRLTQEQFKGRQPLPEEFKPMILRVTEELRTEHNTLYLEACVENAFIDAAGELKILITAHD